MYEHTKMQLKNFTSEVFSSCMPYPLLTLLDSSELVGEVRGWSDFKKTPF